jgi:hypothetical protein
VLFGADFERGDALCVGACHHTPALRS